MIITNSFTHQIGYIEWNTLNWIYQIWYNIKLDTIKVKFGTYAFPLHCMLALLQKDQWKPVNKDLENQPWYHLCLGPDRIAHLDICTYLEEGMWRTAWWCPVESNEKNIKSKYNVTYLTLIWHLCQLTTSHCLDGPAIPAVNHMLKGGLRPIQAHGLYWDIVRQRKNHQETRN